LVQSPVQDGGEDKKVKYLHKGKEFFSRMWKERKKLYFGLHQNKKKI
jgi:hypothetical protein